jgi:dipeptidyl aminopeptidase/acylaminoacyl peptidase
VKETTALAKAMEKGVPTAKIVLLAHAQHRVFESNSADVLREMNAWMATLP